MTNTQAWDYAVGMIKEKAEDAAGKVKAVSQAHARLL